MVGIALAAFRTDRLAGRETELVQSRHEGLWQARAGKVEVGFPVRERDYQESISLDWKYERAGRSALFVAEFPESFWQKTAPTDSKGSRILAWT
jgi:hypothetical protein